MLSLLYIILGLILVVKYLILGQDMKNGKSKTYHHNLIILIIPVIVNQL